MTIHVTKFINELESNSVGKIILINMWDSVFSGLVGKVFVKAFIYECVQLKKNNPTWSCLQVFKDVSLQRDSSDNPIFLRKSQTRSAVTDGIWWTNMVPWTSWFEYHADKQRIDADYGLPIPPISAGVTRSQIPRAQAYFDAVTAVSNWWHPNTGNLGLPLPAPSNCWVSCDAFSTLPLPATGTVDPATESRDALGLIGSEMGAMLVAYKFSANSAKLSSGGDVVRPNFADLGNSRFRAYSKEAQALTFAAGGWGCTVHLAKIAQGKRANTAGRPEKVSKALPIASLHNLSVSILGYVACSRGSSAKDDDDAFVRHLLRRRKIETIQRKLINICK